MNVANSQLGMRRFVLTMQYNENFMLPLFIKHYSKHVSLENIYVVDHGSDENLVPEGVNRIYVPRGRLFSELDRLALIKNISEGLLRYYDYGIYADCDELIALEFLHEKDLYDAKVLYLAGFEVFSSKGVLNGQNKLLGLLNPVMCKPLIFREVPAWSTGFHISTEHSPSARLSIPMAHIRYLFPDKVKQRNDIRVIVHQSSAVNEQSIGVGEHWAHGAEAFKSFCDRVIFLEQIQSSITPFDGIDRELAFEELYVKSFFSKKRTYSAMPDYWYCSEVRYDLSLAFSNL